MPRKSATKSTDSSSETREIVRRERREPHDTPSNAELKRLIEATKTRLENWTIEVERDPNPRMVHVLKNILGHINEFARLTDEKVDYSYKHLSRQMSVLLQEVAELNAVIMDALMDDDVVSPDEEARINERLRRVVQAAVELIRIVQQAFIRRQRTRIAADAAETEER